MADADDKEFPVVGTFSGPVRGRLELGLAVFRGIRYGASPSGAGQMPMGLADVGAPSPIRTALEPILPAPEDKGTENEDCLFLNVWTPSPNGKRPVMIWLHGGGFVAGSARWPVYDGASLARDGDVVVVSLNHRLNIFGFLYLGDIAGAEFAQSGNAGMLDIMLAIWWVRDNIAKFGGDPGNVTVFGESGGGLKVSTLLAMRSARGLVHKAIIQSGPGIRCLSKDAASATAQAILGELGLNLPDDLERLRTIPAHALVAAAMTVQRREQAAGRSFWLAPVMDGITMAAHPFEPKAVDAVAKVPLLIGHTKDEGTFFIATEAQFGTFGEADLQQRARNMAPRQADALVAELKRAKPNATETELIADLFTATWAFSGSVTIAQRKSHQEAPVYAYMLEWQTPVVGGVLRATFNTVESARAFVGPGEAPQVIADQMHAAWIAFAKTGNPNTPGLPDWPPYDRTGRATMMFNLESRIEHDPWSGVRRLLVPTDG